MTSSPRERAKRQGEPEPTDFSGPVAVIVGTNEAAAIASRLSMVVAAASGVIPNIEIRAVPAALETAIRAAAHGEVVEK